MVNYNKLKDQAIYLKDKTMAKREVISSELEKVIKDLHTPDTHQEIINKYV